VFPLVLAVFVGVLVWFSHQIYDFLLPPADTVTVPSFVGQTVSDANTAAERMRLSTAVVDHATSDRYPKGVIINQRPEAGSQVRQGRQISFVISDGIVRRYMPDLRYQSMTEVGLALSRAHLQLGKVSYVRSDFVPDGHVIDQSPQPLADVYEGSTVDLVVSRGGAIEATVPRFIGMKVDDARTLAQRLGIKLGQLVWTPLGCAGPPHGIIARQSIAPGTKIQIYQPVSLQVSAGPYESGYLLRQDHVLVSVPEQPEGVTPGNSVLVTLRVRDATGEYDAYRAYAQPGQKMDVTLTSIGTSVLDMYVNNQLAGEARLGKEPPKIYGPIKNKKNGKNAKNAKEQGQLTLLTAPSPSPTPQPCGV
jgi:eukaryotic-like serine/threonine-protein kinase